MERIEGEVKRELARFGPATGMAEIVAAWPEAVGPGIAVNAWPARLARDGTLHVHAADSIWAFELNQQAPEIRSRLAEALGEGVPKALRFVPGLLPAAAVSEEAKATPAIPEPGPEELRRAAELTVSIADEELRERVARAAALSLARAPSGRSFW